MPFLETSAKRAINVEKAFTTMAGQIKSSRMAHPLAGDSGAGTIKPGQGQKIDGGSGGCC